MQPRGASLVLPAVGRPALLLLLKFDSGGMLLASSPFGSIDLVLGAESLEAIQLGLDTSNAGSVPPFLTLRVGIVLLRFSTSTADPRPENRPPDRSRNFRSASACALVFSAQSVWRTLSASTASRTCIRFITGSSETISRCRGGNGQHGTRSLLAFDASATRSRWPTFL